MCYHLSHGFLKGETRRNLPPSPPKQMASTLLGIWPWRRRGARTRRPHLEGGGPVQLGRVDRFGEDVGDVGDEFLQEPAGFLQVGRVDDDLDQLPKQDTPLTLWRFSRQQAASGARESDQLSGRRGLRHRTGSLNKGSPACASRLQNRCAFCSQPPFSAKECPLSPPPLHPSFC